MNTIGDWLGQQPVILGVVTFVGVVVGGAFALRGVYRTAQSTDRATEATNRATEQDRQEAWWTARQKETDVLREQYKSAEERRDEMNQRLDEIHERLAKMQQDLWECLRERNELRERVVGCDQRIKEIEAQIARLQGGRRGGGADSAPGVI